MKRRKKRIQGLSYAQRVADINRIYDQHARSGLSNREILRRFIWPRYHISEKTFYNMINASAHPDVVDKIEQLQLSLDFDADPEASTS